MATTGTSPVLRQKTFLWGGTATLVFSQLSSVENGYALGSADGPQATASSALLLQLPDWSSSSLASPWLISQSLFPGLATAMGAGVNQQASISLLGSSFSVDAATSKAILALLADAGSTTPQQTLLLELNGLDSSPAISWSSLLPDEQISQLWRINAAAPSLVTVGTSLTGAGAITTRYPLKEDGPALTGASRTFLAGPNDLQAKASDAVALAAAQSTQPAVVQVGLATAPTTTGLVPNGGTDVLVSALDANGNLLWERLFGNSSVEQQPCLAAAADGSVVVGATLQGSLGLNPGAGGQDIGLASYGSDGTLRWRRLLGDAGDQIISDLTVAADGTVLVLGLSFPYPGSLEGLYGQPLRGDGSDFDSFLTAYSPLGDRLWTVQFGSPGDDLALAMAWMPRAAGSGSSVNTLVVVGSQATVAAPDAPKAWVELLELQPTAVVGPSLIPPAPPSLDWTLGSDTVLGLPLAVVRTTAGSGPQLTVQGSSEPGSTVLVRTSLGSAVSSTRTDPTTGRWTLAIDLPQLTANQLGQGFVVVQAQDPQGLLSDSTTAPVLFTGNGLPGELPQMLAIDPDGASGSQAPALLQRQLTAVGDGPLTTAGQRLLVDYSGTLTNGTPFDSSLNPGRRPFDLTLGAGRVIAGWDQGLQGLPLGSQVRLVIPPTLAYGERATGSIPANSTLVFDVDLRADLSIPELFLSQVVWPQLLAPTTYSQTTAQAQADFKTGLDLLGLALTLGPGDGSASADTLTVSPVTGFPTFYPLLAMGGANNDSLSAINQQSNLLFGESGNDLLRSTFSGYAFLDGGPGEDRFETAALISWLRGGSGVDSVSLSSGDWRLLRRGTVAGDPWLELGRYDVAGSAGTLQQIVQLQGVEQLQGLGRLTLTAPSSAGLEASAADLQALLDSLGPAAVLDAKAVTTLSGSAAAVRALLTASRLETAANLAITLTDTTVAAADLLAIDTATTGAVNARSISTITGSPSQRNQVFNALGLSLTLSDDQAPVASQWLVAPADGIYGLAQTLVFGLGFDEPVQVTGTPILQLSDSLQARFDAARSDLGAGRVAFSYTPTSGDQAADLKTNTQPLLFPAGSAITDRSGHATTAQAPAFDAAVAVDGRPPVLNGLSAQGGSYGPNRSVSINLLFNEPVRWQAQSASAAAPVLQLSAGLSANWIAPAPGVEWSATHRFDLFTGSQPPDVQSLQVQGLSGLGQFTDAGGNTLVAPMASSWTLPQSIAISSKVSWTLDVDGDGAVTPLGDGLMVIRKLFGSAFQGDALTAKAISAKATRNSAEIHAYIQQGIDLGLLDIDRNGATTPLGDGLMVIRQLFDSFPGDTLINKAISETSGLIPQGQTLGSLDRTGRQTLADQVRLQIAGLMPADAIAGSLP